jgi:hypothetical protein
MLAEGEVFDATQYAFFGQDACVEEVELGGLEDDDGLPESNEEEFLLNREEVNFHSLYHNCFFFYFKMFVRTIILKCIHVIHIYHLFEYQEFDTRSFH